MDGNKYPDILVGSLDDRIALLRLVMKFLLRYLRVYSIKCVGMNIPLIIHCSHIRARPVIHLSKNFTVEPKIVDPSQCTDTW